MARDGSSKPSKKKPKDQRRNLRLWAEGNREKVLLPYLPDYAAAMGKGSVQERKLLRKICREYHVRIPWTVANHEEPVLQPWDPKAPIPLEVLSEEQEVLKIARVDELNSVSGINWTSQLLSPKIGSAFADGTVIASGTPTSTATPLDLTPPKTLSPVSSANCLG
jgi:hypothetical protein